MALDAGNSVKGPEPSGRFRRARRPACDERSSKSRTGRASIQPVYVLALVVAAGLVAFLLHRHMSRDAQAPAPSVPAAGHESAAPAAGGPQPTAAELEKEAFDVVRQLMADFPGSSGPIALMGTVHDYFGNSAEAIEWWARCLERDPGRAEIYHKLGDVALRKGEYEKAAGLWEKAQQIDPNLPGVYGNYARALMELGRLDEALTALRKEVRLSPGTGLVYLLLGEAHAQKQEYDEAIAAYRQALQIEPDSCEACYGLATAHARLGQQDPAGQYMARFRELSEQERAAAGGGRMNEPSFQAAKILAQTLSLAGRMYLAGRHPGKAEQCWRRAVVLDPENPACGEQLADLYQKTERPEKALEVCERLRATFPGNDTYPLMAAHLLMELKRADAAEEAIRQAIALGPAPAWKLTWAYRALVQILLLRNRELSEAETLAGKLVELAPTASHYALLAEACERNQNPSGALEARRRAAELTRQAGGER